MQGFGWPEVKAFIGAHYEVAAADADDLSFGWPAERPGWRIQVTRADLGGRERVFIGVDICPAADAEAAAALELNGHVYLGALVSYRGLILYRQVLTLGTFGPADLEETIAELGRGARTFRARIARGPASETVAIYSE